MKKNPYLLKLITISVLTLLIQINCFADETTPSQGFSQPSQCTVDRINAQRRTVQGLYYAQRCIEEQLINVDEGESTSTALSAEICATAFTITGGLATGASALLGRATAATLRGSVSAASAAWNHRANLVRRGLRLPNWRRAAPTSGGGFNFRNTALGGAIVSGAVMYTVDRIRDTRVELAGTESIGNDFLCERSGLPVIERSQNPRRCDVDWSNVDAVVHGMASNNGETLRALAATSPDFCDQFDRFLTNLYSDVISLNPLLAGPISISRGPTCNGSDQGRYNYYMQVSNPSNGSPITFHVSGDGSSMRIDDIRNTIFNEASFSLNADGRMQLPISVLNNGSTEPETVNEGNLVGNQRLSEMHNYGDAIAFMNHRYISSIVGECCSQPSRCSELGVNTGAVADEVQEEAVSQ